MPVHVVATDDATLRRLVARGCRPGLSPRAPEIGGMHDLAPLLLDAFDGRAEAVTASVGPRFR